MDKTPFQQYLLEQLLSDRELGPVLDERPPKNPDWWHPPLLPPDLNTAINLNPEILDIVLLEFAEWIIENFAEGHPVVTMLLGLFGLDMNDLLNADLDPQEIIRYIADAIRNWGDPSFGGQLPDFLGRGQIVSGLGILQSLDDPNQHGWGGLYGNLYDLLNEFLDGLNNGTIHADDPQLSDYLSQWIEQIIDMIHEQMGDDAPDP
tara:strand:- start:193 stop:807 length:615 start_codon:yes stop_codon:yes gene_type:complete